MSFIESTSQPVTFESKLRLGDLVYVIKPTWHFNEGAGLIIDILEDDLGTRYFEVDFIEDTGWFESYYLTRKCI